MNDKSASEQITDIICSQVGWKQQVLSEMRTAITAVDPEIVEEIKWRMKSRPEGLAVWSHNGMLCFVEIWKDNIKLLFPKGAHLADPTKLFNARLKSSEIRAIEFHEGDAVGAAGLQVLVHAAN